MGAAQKGYVMIKVGSRVLWHKALKPNRQLGTHKILCTVLKMRGETCTVELPDGSRKSVHLDHVEESDDRS